MVIEIGGIKIDLRSVENSLKVKIPDKFIPFLSNGKPEVFLTFHTDSFPESKSKKQIFVASDVWKMFKFGDKFLIESYVEEKKGEPYQCAVFSSVFKRVDIYAGNQKPCPVFLEYPLDELLLVNLLSRNNGIMVHGCGVIEKGKGLLFLGKSGAGKSTIANLFGKENMVVLSDDRTILRYLNGKFYIFGTPWHGDAGFSSSKKALLKSIFFLEHGSKNSIRRLSKNDFVSRLISTSFLPFWDKKSMECILGLGEKIANKIPSYIFRFYPDKKVIAFIREVNESFID